MSAHRTILAHRGPCAGMQVAPIDVAKPMTRSATRALENARVQPSAGPVPVPRAPALQAAAAMGAARLGARAVPALPRHQQQQGVSMSSLLQSRSEAAVAPHSSTAAPPSPLPDIDSADKLNPLMASEYVNDIYSYYRRVESSFRVPESFMSTQASELLYACVLGAPWAFAGWSSCHSAPAWQTRWMGMAQVMAVLSMAADGRQREDARDPGGLAGGGAPQVQGMLRGEACHATTLTRAVGLIGGPVSSPWWTSLTPAGQGTCR